MMMKRCVLWFSAVALMGSGCGGAFSGDGVGDGGDTGGSGGGITAGGTAGGSTGGSNGSSTITGITTGAAGSITTGASGGTGIGGAGGSTGAGGSGGSGGACTGSSVTFRMVPGGVPGSAGFCVGACGQSWVTVKTPDGHVLGNIDHGCFASCRDCTPIACPAIACVAPHHLASAGEDITWNGTLWPQSTCSGANGTSLACVNQLCVSPGTSLIATMCAYPSTNPDSGSFCTGGPTATCVNVPFTYPTTSIVTGVLDPAR
jgi:hypothetical protein